MTDNVRAQSARTPAMAPANLARVVFVLASHAAMLWFLLEEGLSAYGVLVLAAGESLLVGVVAIAVQAVSQRYPTKEDQRAWHWWEIGADILFRGGLILLVFGGTMALFLWAVALFGQPEEPLVVFTDTFFEAARYVTLAVLGHGLVDLLQVLRGNSERLERLQLTAIFHILIGVAVASFGAVLVVLMKVPAVTLAALIVLKTIADLTVDAMLQGSGKE